MSKKEKKNKDEFKFVTETLREALPLAGYNIVHPSSFAPSHVDTCSSDWIVIEEDEQKPFFNWPSGGQIPTNLIESYGKQIQDSKYESGILAGPKPYDSKTLEKAEEYNVNLILYSHIREKIWEKEQHMREVRKGVEEIDKYFEEDSGYSEARLFQDELEKFSSAKTTYEKKEVLENLIVLLTQKLNLKDIKKDTRTPSSEIDIVARNERLKPMWIQFGTPLLFECKNWEDHVTSNEVRNFILKGTPAKTRFLIAWHGISGGDELKASKLEIIKAKERGVVLIVLTKTDFEKIAGGEHPEFIITEKYHQLFLDKVVT